MNTESSAAEVFMDVIQRNRQNDGTGIYSVCSAHPSVLEAAMKQALEDGSILCVESTSNQVNQYGGYTGMKPAQFVDYLHGIASKVGFPFGSLLLGGDHLGPFPWRKEAAREALEKARRLVQNCVSSGYTKIHLDASMACADDGHEASNDFQVAERAADLCRAAEEAWTQLAKGSPRLTYVIGTEVPVPGGETAEGEAPQPTSIEHMKNTVKIAREAFVSRGLEDAWNRVVGLVVQPGVEFGDAIVFDYDPERAKPLTENLPERPALVYEAHSTDYQTADSLRTLVRDHFAILKVGPWLTFAYREAIFAFSEIEREWLGRRRGVQLSQVRHALEDAMLHNPAHWNSYYPDDEREAQFARAFSFSDRCRYYWPERSVQIEVELMLSNLSQAEVPLTLLSQYLPAQYVAIREERIANVPKAVIEDRIRQVLRIYSAACGNSRT